MNRVMRIPDFCLCDNKDADQLRCNCEADQHLCFGYMDSTIPVLLKFQSFKLLAVSFGLCLTWFSRVAARGFLENCFGPVSYCGLLQEKLQTLYCG